MIGADYPNTSQDLEPKIKFCFHLKTSNDGLASTASGPVVYPSVRSSVEMTHCVCLT